MERERIVWGLVCWGCMGDMTDEMITDICDRHSDVFELKDSEVKLTKVFLKEATNLF